MTTPPSNTSNQDTLEQILYNYRFDSQAVDEDAVLQQYPGKVETAHNDNLYEALEALERINKAKTEQVLREVIGDDIDPPYGVQNEAHEITFEDQIEMEKNSLKLEQRQRAANLGYELNKEKE